jgi:AcrR family transcriptional regulator
MGLQSPRVRARAQLVNATLRIVEIVMIIPMVERHRGAVRSEAVRQAVLEATADLFRDREYDRLTIEGIAAEAGVAKQTIYRWWRSKSELVAECLFEGRLLPEEIHPRDTGDVYTDMTRWLSGLFTFVDTPGNDALLRSLLIVAAENEQVGRRLGASLGADSELTTRLQAAVDSGELPAGTAVGEVVNAMVGAVILHILLREPADDGKAARLVAALLGRA